jgi:hypothetical protein
MAVFHTLMCEKGHFNVDKVKFDQVNSVGIGGGDHLWRQHRDSGRKIPWWRKP